MICMKTLLAFLCPISSLKKGYGKLFLSRSFEFLEQTWWKSVASVIKLVRKLGVAVLHAGELVAIKIINIALFTYDNRSVFCWSHPYKLVSGKEYEGVSTPLFLQKFEAIWSIDEIHSKIVEQKIRKSKKKL